MIDAATAARPGYGTVAASYNTSILFAAVCLPSPGGRDEPLAVLFVVVT